MDEPTVHFSVQRKDLTVFVACLAIGTLHQIRRDHLPPRVGIWSLAAPGFVGPIEEAGLPGELTAVLRVCDELSMLQRHDPPEFFRVVDELIERLEAVVRAVQEPDFRVRWERGSRTDAERALLAAAREAPEGLAPLADEEPPPRMDFDRMRRALEAPPLPEIEAQLRAQLAAEGRDVGPDLAAALAPPPSPPQAIEAAIAAWIGRRQG
jgi:hypothetical protein